MNAAVVVLQNVEDLIEALPDLHVDFANPGFSGGGGGGPGSRDSPRGGDSSNVLIDAKVPKHIADRLTEAARGERQPSLDNTQSSATSSSTTTRPIERP